MGKTATTWQGTSIDPQQTRAIGYAIGRHLAAGDLAALNGPLGSGKTQLIRGLAEGRGIDPAQVSSPTYVIAHEYEPAASGGDAAGPLLVHLDAYRIETLDELESIGWGEQALYGGDAIIAIEWADRLGNELPPHRLTIELAHAAEQRRRVRISAGAGWETRWPALQQALKEAGARPGKCPICKGRAWRGLPAYPFCSNRCRLVDLNKWLGEDYRISRPIEMSDIEQE